MKKGIGFLLFLLFPFLSFSQKIDTFYANGSVNLRAFGAKLDGVTDDAAAWQSAINYVTSIKAKSRVIEQEASTVSRIAKPFVVIGGYFIPVDSAFKNIGNIGCTDCNYGAYLDGYRKINCKIIGRGESCVYFDFNDTTKLTSCFYIGAMYGASQASSQQYNLEISNIGFYAKGYFKDGKRDYANVIDYSKNNCVAIAALFTQGLKIKDVTIYGFKEGIVSNNNYFFDINGVTFNQCKRGAFDLRSHSSKYEGINVFDCGTGVEIRSNKIRLNDLYALRCKTGLRVAGSNVTVNNTYFESPLFTEGQLVVGDDSVAQQVEQITFNDLTIAAAYPTRIGIYLKSNVKNITINSATVQSQYIVYNSLATRIYSQSILGTLPTAITLKQTYTDINGKIITQ